MKAILAFLGFFAFAALGAFDVRVIDGDTVNVPAGLVVGIPARISVRLIGINAPETYAAKCANERAQGEAAKLYMRDRFAKATKVKIEFVRWDKYGGRLDGRITLDDSDLAADLIKEKYAMPYSGGKRVNYWCP